jgi:hypothetical protein
VPAALLCGTLAAAKWATATAFPASRVHLAPLFERPALTPRVTWGRAKPRPLAGSNPSDAARRNACVPVQALAAWIASRQPSWTDRARKAQYKSRPTRVPFGNWWYRCLSGLFLVRPINVAELGQARVARCELDQLAAGRGLSLKHPHQHAGGANLKALAVALPLPRFIGQFFGFDRDALTENAIGKLAVAALTLSGETTLTLPAFERPGWLSQAPSL